MTETISIYKAYDSIEAEMVKSKLENEGIICFLKSDNAGGFLPHMTFAGGIDVMVQEQEAELALNLLKES